MLARDLEVLDGRGKLLSARLNLVEQPRVLDFDHRLVGEGLKKTDFVLREWTDHTARNTDCADPTVDGSGLGGLDCHSRPAAK